MHTARARKAFAAATAVLGLVFALAGNASADENPQLKKIYHAFREAAAYSPNALREAALPTLIGMRNEALRQASAPQMGDDEKIQLNGFAEVMAMITDGITQRRSCKKIDSAIVLNYGEYDGIHADPDFVRYGREILHDICK